MERDTQKEEIKKEKFGLIKPGKLVIITGIGDTKIHGPTPLKRQIPKS